MAHANVLFPLLSGLFVWLLVTTGVAADLLQEPMCSKFSFEEKVLEKLVRMEHKMELLQDKMTAWEKRLDDKLTVLNGAGEKVAASLNETEEKGKVVVAKMERLIADTQSDITLMTNELIENTKTRIQTFINGSSSTTIAFQAREVTDLSPSTGARLVFSTEVLNVGGAYDRSTGVFTAPRAGIYLFTVQICTNKGHYANVYIMAKDRMIGAVTQHDSERDDMCNSGNGLAWLEKGDTAWVKCDNGGSGVLRQDRDEWNVFSGVLIK